jgi:EpsI family protein
MLRADFNLQRAYRHSLGDFVWLYVGYYGTARGGRPEHTPWVCYPAAGWGIETSRELVVDPAKGLRANELVVEAEGERRLVLFWYRSERRTGITGSLALSLSHLRDRLLRGRADIALVRVSTPIEDGDETAARARLAGFAVTVDEQLAGHWPVESRP